MARTESEQLVFSVEARIAAMEKQMARAGRVTDKTFTGMERRGKTMTGRLEKTMAASASRVAGLMKSFGAGFLGGLAAGGVAGIVSQFGSVAKGIAEIGDSSRRAGLSNKAFQELGYVAKANRIQVDALADGMKELSIRADEYIATGKGSAAESFKRLGITAADLKLKLQDPSALFTEIIGKLGQLDKAAQIRISDELFGGTGGEKFVQLIAQGEDGIKATIREAHNLGAVLSDDVIERAAELDRKFNVVATTVGSALKTAIVEAAGALQKFIDQFRDFENRSSGTLKDRFGELQTRYGQLVKQRGTMEDKALGLMGKDAATEIEAVKAEMDQIAAQLRQRATPMLREKLVAQNTANTPYTPPPSSGGRASSTKAVRTERDAVAELIARLEEEKALIGATDLERETSNAIRRAGADATDDQKAKIISLVAAIHAETEAQQKASDAAMELRDIGRDVLGGFISDLQQGKSAADALASALQNVANRLLNSALDGLFGGGGGFFSSLFRADGGIVHAASGGKIRGPGGPKSDKIPAMLSNGEFVMSARATKAFGPLLESLNQMKIPLDGFKIPKLALGGLAFGGERGPELMIERRFA